MVETRIEKIAVNAPGVVYVDYHQWPYISEFGDSLAVRMGLAFGPYVESGLEAYVLNALSIAVEGHGGKILYLEAKKGVGKSTAAIAAIYRLLKRERDVAVVAVDLGVPVDIVKTSQFIRDAKRIGYVPLFYLDASPPEAYSYGVLTQPRLSDVASNLAGLLPVIKSEEAAALLVLSSNEEAYIVEEVDKLYEVIEEAERISTDIDGERFYAELMRRYSGCPDDVAKRALNALSDLRDYYAYAVVKMARRLKERNCAEDLESAAKEVKNSALRHALEYLWHVVYGRRLSDEQARSIILAAYAMVSTKDGPPRRVLENAMIKAVYSAISRRFYVGKDELCKRGGGACKLVELLADHIARKVSGEYKSVEEVLAAYVARSVVDALPE